MSGIYSKQRIPEYASTRKPAIELDIIADVDSLGGYEWDRFMVLRNPEDGFLYTVQGSGCSCNYLLEDVYSLRDLEGPYTVHEVAAIAQEWEHADDMGHDRAGLGTHVVESLLAMERNS